MKDQIFIAFIGIIFCYGILLLTLDLKNYCEYSETKNFYYANSTSSKATESDYKSICYVVQKKYINNIVYEKFLNSFYNNFKAKSMEKQELETYIANNSYSHLKVSAEILKLTQCSLYCLGLFICVLIIPNIFFFLMKAFLQRILVYIFILFVFEAICNFYLGIPFNITTIVKTIDYFNFRAYIAEGLISHYFDMFKKLFISS